WRTLLARGTQLSTSLGAGIGRSRSEDKTAATVVYAVGGADLRSTPWRNVSASVGALVEPLGDPLSGDLIERGSVRVAAVWDRHRMVALSARVMGSVALTSGSRSEEHTSELQSRLVISYAVFCLKKKKSKPVEARTRVGLDNFRQFYD